MPFLAAPLVCHTGLAEDCHAVVAAALPKTGTLQQQQQQLPAVQTAAVERLHELGSIWLERQSLAAAAGAPELAVGAMTR
eukprot:SAG22_NODE_1870_length_3401_cov_5.551484_3_plen_80_part_00